VSGGGKKYKIALIPGDGIGPEVTREAVRVLNAVGGSFGRVFEYTELPAGGAAIDAAGEPLPAETLETARAADGVLLGAVGGWRWDGLPGDKRPEAGLLGLRAGLGLFANLRPAKLIPALASACPLKATGDIDILVARELTGGIYFGEKGRDGDSAYDVERYSRGEVRRIAGVAFGLAAGRRGRVTSVDKANVLESSRLWRETVIEAARDYPGVELEHMYVDNASMQLIRDPSRFDVLLTSNMFGDILSDEAAQITGSIGLLPSASLRADGFGLYEPVHGSAPDIAGKNIANPCAAILSAGMMLRYSFGLTREADALEIAVYAALEDGIRTADIAAPGGPAVTTEEMGEAIANKITALR
jgi:3-isopropylmalate dehydrogenase